MPFLHLDSHERGLIIIIFIVVKSSLVNRLFVNYIVNSVFTTRGVNKLFSCFFDRRGRYQRFTCK